MKEEKALTPQKVSAVLKKAGFERSEETTTGIRGWHDHSEGYAVRSSSRQGTVHVHYWPSPYSRGDAELQRRTKMLVGYVSVLQEAGLRAEFDSQWGSFLIVTK